MQHHIFLVIIVCVFVGIGIGFIFRAVIAEEVLATKSELAMWRQRLDSAATGDVIALKREAQTVASEIKAKL
jgi:phosphotransferase system  glucose/maltose/N-acetylglucosamine-specific IIC component